MPPGERRADAAGAWARGDVLSGPEHYHVYKLPEPPPGFLEEIGRLPVAPREIPLDEMFVALAQLRRCGSRSVRSHVLDGLACPCGPEVRQPCPQCDEPPAPDCWRCSGRGLVEPFDDALPCVVIHRFP